MTAFTTYAMPAVTVSVGGRVRVAVHELPGTMAVTVDVMMVAALTRQLQEVADFKLTETPAT